MQKVSWKSDQSTNKNKNIQIKNKQIDDHPAQKKMSTAVFKSFFFAAMKENSDK